VSVVKVRERREAHRANPGYRTAAKDAHYPDVSPSIAVYIQTEAAAELEAHAPEDLELAMIVLEQWIAWRDQGERVPDCLLETLDVFEAAS
jgi:hypothetical protein